MLISPPRPWASRASPSAAPFVGRPRLLAQQRGGHVLHEAFDARQQEAYLPRAQRRQMTGFPTQKTTHLRVGVRARHESADSARAEGESARQETCRTALLRLHRPQQRWCFPRVVRARAARKKAKGRYDRLERVDLLGHRHLAVLCLTEVGARHQAGDFLLWEHS
jgi:hypothetical protein